MKKSILFLAAIMMLASSLSAQNVSLKMKRPPINQLKTADLWSATIVNPGEPFTAYLFGSMTNNENDELIATGQTMTFEVKKGTTNFKISDLPRIPDVNYLSKDPKYKTSFMNTGGAPAGDYKICCELRKTDNSVAGEDCFDQKIIGGDAPQLISPRNEEELRIDNPVFTWMHMKGPGSTQTYKIKIVEIKGDESPENAMLKNKAFFEKEGISQQLFQYPSSAPSFEPGKKYAWQVSVNDLKSEISTFVKQEKTQVPSTNKSLPTFCTDFENLNNINNANWITYNNDNGNIYNTTNNLQFISPGAPFTPSNQGLHITDISGSTFIVDTIDFKGDYTHKLGSCLCFDFRLKTNDTTVQVNPKIYLLQKFNSMQQIVWGTNPILAAVFTANVSIAVNSNWVHVCAPIDLCSNGSLPSNADGSWQMVNNGTCSDWASLLSNVTGVMFSVDMSGWTGTEIFDIDNVCITNCSWPPSQSGNICDSLKAVAVSNAGAGDCCWSLNLTHPVNTSNINTVQFLCLSPNSFASKTLGNSSGWFTQTSNGQEFTVRRLGTGTIPPGQQNGFFNFCLNKLSSPQHVVVNWKHDSTLVCSDTVTLNCEIPCVTFTKDTLLCNGSNYDLHYSFTNNASFPIGKIDVVSSPAGITVTPATQTLSPALNSGQTTNQLQFSISGAVPNTQACFVMKFTSPDGCCWCYDTLCVNVPSCMCNEVGATITGDQLNCCYSLNLQNNFSGNYFTQVNIRPLETGVNFSTWFTNMANNFYSTNSFPDNEIHLINDPVNFPNSYIPSGNSANVINFCLHGYTSPTQHVIIEWMRNDSVKCRDTLVTNCSPLPPPTNCTQVINDTLTCLPNGTYQYTFHIRNNSSHTTTGFQFNPVSPAGLTFTPANFSNVTIAPGMISPQQTMIISGVSPGSTFCYKISLYEHILQAGQQYYDWCCYSDTICKTAPVCSTGNSCNYGAVIDSITCKQNAAGPQQYNIWARINNSTGTTTTLGNITVSNGTMSCSPTAIPPGMTNINCTYTVTGTSQNNPCFIFRILKPSAAIPDTCEYEICKPLPVCTTTTNNCKFEVMIDSTTCKQNAAGQWYYNVATRIYNMGTAPATLNSILADNGTMACAPVTLAPGMNSINCSYIPSGTVTNPTCFTYRILNHGSTDTCKYKICRDLPTCGNPTGGCNCNNGKWMSDNSTIRYSLNGTSIDKPIICGDSYTVDAGTDISLWPQYACSLKNCTAKYTYKVNSNAVTSYQNSPYNVYNISSPTNVTIYAWCGDKICDSCKITIAPHSSGCDCGEWKSKKIVVNINGKKVEPVLCGGDLEIKLSDFLGLSFPEFLCKPKDCKATYTWDLRNESGLMMSGTENPFTYEFPSPGVYILSYKAYCGGKVCDSCFVKIKVTGEVGNCDCGGWYKDDKGFTVHSSNGSPGVNFEKFVKCGTTSPNINKGVVIDFVSQKYICKPEKNCNASYKWTITTPSGVTTNYNSQTISSFALSEVGLYTVYLTPLCGGKLCDECKSYIKVVKIDY